MDGSPDSSHTEQYAVVMRYALLEDKTWEVMERFLTYRDCEKKRGEDIEKAICDVLEKKQIDSQ